MMVELALVLPVLVLTALLAGSLSEEGVARLRVQEAARVVAWKRAPDTKAEAERSLKPLAGARVEGARRRSATFTKGSGDQDPLLGGWASQALGTATAEVELSIPPRPWGGERLRFQASHTVDRGRDGDRKGWVRRTVGIRSP